MNIHDNGAVFSSDRMNWETPQWLFDELNDEFHFTLDAAADSKNFKVLPFLTAEQDALKCKWSGQVWCNPPYGRDIGKWVQKAYEESVRGGGDRRHVAAGPYRYELVPRMGVRQGGDTVPARSREVCWSKIQRAVSVDDHNLQGCI